MTDLTYHQANELFRHFPGFLSIRNSSHEYVYINDKFNVWLRQYTDINPIGMTANALSQVVPENVANMLQECHDASIDYIESGQCIPKIVKFQSLHSTFYYNVLKFKVDIEGESFIYTTSFDVSELHQEAKFFEKKAYTDPLTKLRNLTYLSSIRWKKGFCVVIDLDNFKQINDNLGHSEGDLVLLRFARCLRQSFSDKDVIVRYGGDEFVVLTHYENEDTLKQSISKLHRLFIDDFQAYPELCHSIGYSAFQSSLRITLKKADLAMYQSKHDKRAKKPKVLL
ncbi:GGDEF domain-containing protein [Vibrio sp. CyArs1]|uniref:GGDEF domain-containing protein n=1 Tax=Vibrio sp. CyArs1 TaxID=2682577 RepID=UPI001F053A1D|nr:GGDEF domain-containing protein [Vibrio sp. CyArs1]